MPFQVIYSDKFATLTFPKNQRSRGTAPEINDSPAVPCPRNTRPGAIYRKKVSFYVQKKRDRTLPL